MPSSRKLIQYCRNYTRPITKTLQDARQAVPQCDIRTSFSQVKLVLMLELSDCTECSIRSQVFIC